MNIISLTTFLSVSPVCVHYTGLAFFSIFVLLPLYPASSESALAKIHLDFFPIFIILVSLHLKRMEWRSYICKLLSYFVYNLKLAVVLFFVYNADIL